MEAIWGLLSFLKNQNKTGESTSAGHFKAPWVFNETIENTNPGGGAQINAAVNLPGVIPISLIEIQLFKIVINQDDR